MKIFCFQLKIFNKILKHRLKILNLKSEFKNLFKNVPVNEKILRSINRELNVKEALFFTFTSKKGRSINKFCCCKTSIKI